MAKLLYPLAMFSVILLGGCSIESNTAGKQEQEILIAHDCGMDKLQCCKSEPACFYSQECCVDPNDPNRNYCADECTFGGRDEFCEVGSECDNGLACSQGICETCGGEEDICCADNRCGSGLVCDAGKCVECGIEGNICCSGGKCANDGASDGSRTGCLDNSCQLCGSGGRACPGEVKCLPGHLLNNGVCFKCGEANEPCCNEGSGLGYQCDPKKYLSCFQGFCLE